MLNALDLRMNHSDILHCPVMDQSSATPLGNVSAIWLDLINHQILGLSSRVGFWDTVQTYPWRQIIAIESGKIWVESSSTAHPSRVLHLESKVWTATEALLKLGVWTHMGQWMGDITDYSFDATTGSISAYLCSVKGHIGLAENLLAISPDMIMDAGPGWILVPDEVMPQAGLETKKTIFSTQTLALC